MSPSASTQDLAVHLTALPDREVAALLVARPDLAAPPSSSFLALATRAGGSGQHRARPGRAGCADAGRGRGGRGSQPDPDESGRAGGAGLTEAAEVVGNRRVGGCR